MWGEAFADIPPPDAVSLDAAVSLARRFAVLLSACGPQARAVLDRLKINRAFKREILTF